MDRCFVRKCEWFGAFLLLVSLGACAFLDPPVFTEKQLSGVVTNLDPSSIVRDYREIAGETVLVGGTIEEIRNTKDRGLMEINLYPLNNDMRPEKSMAPSGLVLLRFDEPINRFALSSGQRVTAIGKVMAMRRPVPDGDHLLRLVVIDAGDFNHLHTWPTREQQTGGMPGLNSNPGLMPAPGLGGH
ncbi:MAG: Slp family lipoprotein [Leptospirillum sp.]